MNPQPPWVGVFQVLEPDGTLTPDQGIPLRQVTTTQFQVDATLRYLGETGLDSSLDPVVRELPFDPLRLSDLASVPAAFGWFEEPHGLHTPAALFHDYLLERPDLVRPDQADLLFRHMLKALGMARIRRNLLWTAVVFRTRWVMARASLVFWSLLSITGLTLFVLALVGVELPAVLGGRVVVLAVTAFAPLPASLLWGKERRAALVAAVMAIWVLPAAAIAVLALAAYQLLERAVAAVWGSKS